MQNPNVKYLKMPNGYFCLFYRENNILFLRTNTGTDWSSPQILAERTGTTFSICQFGEVCYVLYSSMEGNLYLASSIDFVNWEHKPLMGGTTNSSRPKYFMVPTEDALHMIYHLPTEIKGIESLVYTSFRKGRWENPTQIDRFIPFGRTAFFARRLSRDHIILYYRISRNTWSAREMLLSPYTLGNLTPLVQAPTNFIDICIVNDMERIHTLYIIRNMFRTQVLYQYKQTTAISTPRVLWEDMNCDNALAFLENGKLVLMWTVNGQPLRCISDNNGASFGAVERYTGNFPVQCIKGELISAEGLDYNAMETYGDISKDYNPFLLINASDPIPKLQALPFEKEVQPLSGKQEKPSQPIYFTQEPQPQPNRFTQETSPQRIPFVQETRPSHVAQESQPQRISYGQETAFGRFVQESQPQPTPFVQETQSGLFVQEPASQHTSYGRETQFPYIPQETTRKHVSYEQETQSRNFSPESNPQPISYGQEAQQKPLKKTTSRQNAQKQQLEELTALLAQRSDEITEVNARWKTQISRLESELDALRKENETLKQSLNAQLTKKQRSASVQHIQAPRTEEESQKLQAAENISLPSQEIQQSIADSPKQVDQKTEPEE